MSFFTLFRLVVLVSVLCFWNSEAILSGETCSPALTIPRCDCEFDISRYVYRCRGISWPELKSLLMRYANSGMNVDFAINIQDFLGDLSIPSSDPILGLPVLKTQFRGLSIARAAGIQTFPDLSWASGVQELRLTGLPALSNWDFRSSVLPPNLETLEIESTRLTKISYEMLQGMTKLKTLLFSGHAGLAILDRPFRDLSQLDELGITGGLANLPARAFDGIMNLRMLNLSSNGLASLTSDRLKALKNLVALDLSGNELESFPSDLLEGMTRLRFVSFASNSLRRIPDNVFRHSQNLTELSFAENQIVSISDHTFKSATKLASLDLRGNRLERLPGNVFHSLNSLVELNLQENLIRLLGDKSFMGLRNVRYLNVCCNGITTVASHALSPLKSLEILDISNNEIEKLVWNNEETYSRSLRSLNVSGNKLRILDKTVINGLHNMTELQLNDNELSCSCDNLELVDYLQQNSSSVTPVNLYCIDTRDLKIKDLALLNETNCEPASAPTPVQFVRSSLEGLFLAGSVLFLAIFFLVIGITCACALNPQFFSYRTYYPNNYGVQDFKPSVEIKGTNHDMTTVL